MTSPAAVIIPTRDRAAYLDVALASIAPQSRAAGAEMIVVLDGPDPASRAVATRHGARLVEHDEPRGLNAARNTGARATDAELLVYVDDDVEVRAGWLDGLLTGHAALSQEYGVLTGPIHGRLEDHQLRSCGREGPPMTSLELGPDDVDADHAWGANMAVRRSALERAGPFDEARELYGDEQEWQTRLRSAGGRIRYIAAAALDHRRAGDDARLRNLSGAAYRRGSASRRFDRFKGVAPSAMSELRTLVGCLLHVPRFRCLNGVVMTAHSAGRVRALADELLAPGGGGGPDAYGGGAADEDFLSGASGTVGGRRAALLRIRDAWLDLRTAPRRARLRGAARRALDPRRVLVLAIDRPEVPGLLPGALAELRRTRHDVVVRTAAAGTGGKFENLNALLAEEDLPAFDWLLVVDDDVALPRGFLDNFLYAAELAGLRLAQPAHRLHSHAAWALTRRRSDAIARETNFVEIGPVTAFERTTFTTLLPFPELQMGWGLDLHWAAVAGERGWPIGVVDATPVGHTLRPVADTYPRAAAIAEARAFLADRPYVRRRAVRTLAVHR